MNEDFLTLESPGQPVRKVLRRGPAQFVRGTGVRPADRVKDLTVPEWTALFRAYGRTAHH
ncbi:hypothetical protein [Streptomyces sp. NPDC016675]|uniref:hypothetical protein n=1 Tax=Streptomyces sp. NPDC016675 TaxID=3364970 RepID=UPI0036FC2C5C